MHAIKALGSIIENLLGVLGFRPVESLVTVTVQGGEVGCVMRLDLADAALPDAPEQLADLAARSGADGVVAVFVSAESTACAMCADEFRDQARNLSVALERRGMELLDAVVVDQVAAGGQWRCVDNCGVSGILGDPSASAAAAAAVAAGHRMYGSREEMKATVAVDVARTAVLAPMLAGAGGPVEDVAVAVRAAVALVRRVGEGAVLSDAELAAVGAMLVDLRVRDALMTLVDCDEAGAAEQLWSQLVPVLPQPFRSEALVLKSHAAYVRGEGPLAGVCLEAVQAEDPTHRMAELLDTALQSGVRPEAIRGLTAALPPAVSV
uniref:DUF4192 domain-containing protein n=2 Tax=unclassified Mycobacterium TaxID=2642494 RepID=A0A5Q5BT71_MYCSS